MNYTAIISEFNPFTNGHKYIISEAKAKLGQDVICLMSGNFVQRGEIAILDKYERATAAIKNGASIAIELPLVYALSSAEVFANGAIKILSGMKNVTHLAFGVETDNTTLLEKLAKAKVEKSSQIKEIIKKETKNGLNYSKAMVIALKTVLKDDEKEIDKLFTGANNILAIEYLSAIYKLKASLIPVYIKRTDNGYNSNKVAKIKINKKTVCFANASYIRELANSGKLKELKSLTPPSTYSLLEKQNKSFYQTKNIRLETLILNKLRKLEPKELEKYYDYNQSLANLIYKTARQEFSLENIVKLVSGKSFRPARVKKLILYPLFNITKSTFEEINNSHISVNVLAVAEGKKQDLSQLKNQSETSLVVSYKDYNSIENKKSLELNQLSSDIYNLVTNQPASQDKTVFV